MELQPHCDESHEVHDNKTEIEILTPHYSSVGKINHCRRDRLRIYYCTECDYQSYRQVTLIRHMKIHPNRPRLDRKYRCLYCKKYFCYNELLESHINKHLGVKPFKCSVEHCSMAFVTKSELTRHSQCFHTKGNLFKCTMCNYTCLESANLQLHIQSHMGGKPCKCESSSKEFSGSSKFTGSY